jgi:hypothetical protein
MIRSVLTTAFMVALLALPAAALGAPQTSAVQGDVADAFIAAAKTQDRQAALNLLASDVSIEFPTGRGEGRPFVIGYLDGLFDADRGLSLDSAASQGDSVRFLAHEDRSRDRYAIEVEVKDHRVVKVTVNLDQQAALASLPAL